MGEGGEGGEGRGGRVTEDGEGENSGSQNVLYFCWLAVEQILRLRRGTWVEWESQSYSTCLISLHERYLAMCVNHIQTILNWDENRRHISRKFPRP